MIGCLPDRITANGKEYGLHTDFRRALAVLEGFADPGLADQGKVFVAIDALVGIEKVNPEDQGAVFAQLLWYLDGGKEYSQSQAKKPRVMDWKHDEQLLFSAVNKVAGTEVRELEHLHWWTFLGYFNEITEGLFSTVLAIRQKKAKGKKLSDWEKDFYKENKAIVDLPGRLSESELAERKRLNDLFQ